MIEMLCSWTVKADEPYWTPILRELYQREYAIDREMRGDLPGSTDAIHFEDGLIDELSEKTGRNSAAVQRTVDTMIGYGLLEREDRSAFGLGSPTEIGLTRKGFDVAHDRERSRQQERTNCLLLLFTAVLAIASILNLLVLIY